MESVFNNLVFALEAWPETGQERDFALSPATLTELLASGKNLEQLPVVDQGENQSVIPKILTSMRGHIKLMLVGRKLKVKGFFAVKVELICARCLTPFVSRIDDKFDDLIKLREPGKNDLRGVDANQDLDQEGDDSAIVIRDGQSFDLAPLMAEFFWLAFPYKALCRDDCAGLCPRCGANLNEGPCYCPTQQPTKH
ncbi:MAG: DUF177 domain-containing protein [Deltaproteobacteria bacterium]|nr:DUF177 domain-containing protein [Deltaproteobacteria bacterium]